MRLLTRLFAFVVLILITTTAQSQISGMSGGELTGIVRDKESGITLPGANIQLYILKRAGPVWVTGTSTDVNGVYTIPNLEPADYITVTSSIGYGRDSAQHRISKGEIEVYNPELGFGILTAPVVIDGSKKIDLKGEEGYVITIELADLKRMPQRNPVAGAVSKSVKIYDAKGDGTQLNFGGSRSDANALYIDGVRVTGSSNVPMGAVSSVSVYTGGIPAKYGDFTGGVISITTRSFDYFTVGND